MKSVLLERIRLKECSRKRYIRVAHKWLLGRIWVDIQQKLYFRKGRVQRGCHHDLADPTASWLILLKYDSRSMESSPDRIGLESNNSKLRDQKIPKLFGISAPPILPWKELDIDL